MATSTTTYQPGVCNIGPAEIRMRRRTGWLGAIVTVLALVGFVLLHTPDPWRVIIVLPAGLGATGFLQAAFHFCAAFGMGGLFNFGDMDDREEVHEKEYRRKDQRKALLIVGLAGLIALAVFGIAVLLP